MTCHPILLRLIIIVSSKYKVLQLSIYIFLQPIMSIPSLFDLNILCTILKQSQYMFFISFTPIKITPKLSFCIFKICILFVNRWEDKRFFSWMSVGILWISGTLHSFVNSILMCCCHCMYLNFSNTCLKICFLPLNYRFSLHSGDTNMFLVCSVSSQTNHLNAGVVWFAQKILSLIQDFHSHSTDKCVMTCWLSVTPSHFISCTPSKSKLYCTNFPLTVS